jgi:hypothetical protein
MIVYISIGNSDDKLTQRRWADFVAEVGSVIARAGQIHGSWYSASDAPWQNACWCVEIAEATTPPAAGYFPMFLRTSLKNELRGLAQIYAQDSIAWAEVKETEFLG